MNLLKTKIRNIMILNAMNSLLYIRCGLKRLIKGCQSFQITKELIQKCDTNIYNIITEPSESEVFNM